VGQKDLDPILLHKLNSSVEESDEEAENLMSEPANKPRAKTRENWFKDDGKSFSKISEEETITDKNSYGFRLIPKKKKYNVRSLVSSYF